MDQLPKFDFSKKEEMVRFKALAPEAQEEIINAAHEEALGMILAETLHMEYEKGGAAYESGVSSRRVTYGGEGKKDRVDGRAVIKGGYGSYVYAIPSQFKLWVKLPGSEDEVDIWTSRDFREQMGVQRLTEKIRKAIEMTKPGHVALVEKTSERGTKYYRIDPDQLIDWAQQAKGKLDEAGTQVKAEKVQQEASRIEAEKKAKKIWNQLERNERRKKQRAAQKSEAEAAKKKEVDLANLLQQLQDKYKKE